MQLELYVNDRGFWVLKVALESVESEAGLIAYVNVMLRRHAAVAPVRLAKVVEHWSVTPGDGHIYFASALLRAQWQSVRCATLRCNMPCVRRFSRVERDPHSCE